MTHRLSLTCIVALAVVTLSANRSWSIEGPEWSPDIVASFDIEKDAEELLLPVVFRGHTYLFVLDTGADLTIYDSQFQSHFGEPLRTSRIKTANGEMRVDLFRSPSAKLGELDLQTQLPIACLDLSQVRQATGYDVQGMIGMSFLRNHVVQIDLDDGKVSFLRSVPHDAGRPIRIFYRSLHPRVDADVAGIAATFTVDTGCSHSANIDTSIFDQLVERQHVSAIGSTQSTALSGIKRWKDGRVDTIGLDEFIHRNLVVAEARGNQLGLRYLSRYVVTFDFPSATMYLKPGKRYDMADRRDLSGLHILSSDGRILVHSVDEGSPAALAGVSERDVITSVERRPASDFSLPDLRRLLTNDGLRIRMTVNNSDGAARQVAFVLQEWRKNRFFPEQAGNHNATIRTATDRRVPGRQ